MAIHTSYMQAIEGAEPTKPAPITDAELAKKLRALYAWRNGSGFKEPARAHQAADELISDLLKHFGYTEAMAIYDAAEHWYE